MARLTANKLTAPGTRREPARARSRRSRRSGSRVPAVLYATALILSTSTYSTISPRAPGHSEPTRVLNPAIEARAALR